MITKKLVALTESAKGIKRISKQTAIDKGFFGPVYHGTTDENMEAIIQHGFKLKGVMQSNGYPNQPYAPGGNIPAPVHHLGYGIYFTTVKAIAKQYGSKSNPIEFYLDAPRMLKINFASPNTMMNWWFKWGYSPSGRISNEERIKQTEKMTRNLKKEYDAVWFLGKTIRKVLDGDQICIYNPAKIYMIDNSKAKPYDVGSMVTYNYDFLQPYEDAYAQVHYEPDPDSDWMLKVRVHGDRPPYKIKHVPPKGMKGMIVEKIEAPVQSLPPRLQNQKKHWMKIKWQKGGIKFNYIEDELLPVPMKRKKR